MLSLSSFSRSLLDLCRILSRSHIRGRVVGMPEDCGVSISSTPGYGSGNEAEPSDQRTIFDRIFDFELIMLSFFIFCLDVVYSTQYAANLAEENCWGKKFCGSRVKFGYSGNEARQREIEIITGLSSSGDAAFFTF